jgi:hypothetical protein
VPELAEWPDAELLAREVILTEPALGLSVGTQVPADPGGSYDWLPFCRVQCIGGQDDLLTDLSRLSVDVFAPTKATAAVMAELVRQRLLAASGALTDHGAVDRVSTLTKPSQVPYGDQARVVRYAASYAITTRRTP